MDGLVGMHRVVVSVSVHLHKSWLIWLCVKKNKWYGLWIVDVLCVLKIAWLICIYVKCCEHDWYACVFEVWIISVMLGMWIVVLIGVVRTIVYVSCYVDIYNYTQWYYNPVSHPSAVVKCSMRHCRLDAGGLLRRLALRSLVGLSALICSTGSREIVMYYMYVMTFGWYLDDLYYYKQIYVFGENSVIDIPLLFCNWKLLWVEPYCWYYCFVLHIFKWAGVVWFQKCGILFGVESF